MIMWPENNNSSVEPPEVKPMPKRPPRCRRKDKDEPRKKKWGKASKNEVKMTCSKCYQVGHNRRGCKPVPSKQSSKQPSQPRPMNQPSTQHSSFLCPETSRVKGTRKQATSSSTTRTTSSSVGRKRTKDVGKEKNKRCGILCLHRHTI